MDNFFALCLTEHYRWGYVLAPYMLAPLAGKDCLLVHDPVTGGNLEKYETRLTATQIKLVNWIDQYSEREMARVMRRKTSPGDFMRSLTDEAVTKEIRPYIERRLLHCFDLLPGSDIPLYLKDTPERVYPENEIRYGNEPAEAVFNFHYRPADGLRYFLSVYCQGKEMSLLGKRLIPLVSQPSVMLLDNDLLRFKDIDSKKLTPFVARKHIAVSKQVEEKYFKTFVIESIRKFRTNVQGFVIADDAPVPVAVVSLENDLRYRPVMVLRFEYGHKTFNAATPSETEVSLDMRDGQYTVKRFRRDYETEKAFIGSLCDLGFYYAGNSMFYADEASALTTDTGDQLSLANLVEKLNSLSDALAAKGFRIDQHFFLQKYFTGAVKLEVMLKTERDWFDVHAVVHFGGFNIPFINFRSHILRQDRNYTLPNGDVLILPAEWMAKYAQAMLMAEHGADTLRLSKRYFTIVNDTFEGVDKKYLHSMTALCNVDEMEPGDAPERIHATLRPYQLQGVAWLRVLHDHRLGGCLADDMGLGKTLQAITLLQSVLDDETVSSPGPESEARTAQPSTKFYLKSSLVVMPSSLVHNWANEINRFAPHLKVLKYVGPDRQNHHTNFAEYHIVLTTYGVLRNDAEILRKYHFLYAILDEAQYIRNPESATCQSAMLIEADHYLTLSGTPVENTLTDLWAQMNFLNRGLLGDLNFFRTHFSIPVEKHNDETARTRLQRLVQPFLLRRTKQEVTPELPELTELVRYCEMTDMQRSIYEEEKSKMRNEIIESIEEQGVEKSGMMVLRALGRLRQLAIHPAMIHPGYAADSGKFDQIVESLDNLRSEGHKALLFSSFTKHLDMVAARLQTENIPYAMLTGKTRNREEVIDRFNQCPDVPFFLISLKAGGVGLNLTAADYVFLLDPWWNPAAERQAISRTHRIGQTGKVFAYRMITSDTIEEKILQLQEKKLELADILSRSANPFRNMTAENVMELFE
ncbi:MAG: DEAD/DEAH box helicase [Bacteroidales bacterium]|jgi:superfamily II DNA or RNA helicase|nr:DEAD/DEAH box helicase [Bacteroidales bacterium]